MTTDQVPDELSLPQRVVLLSLTHCVETDDDGSVHTGDVIRTARAHLDLLGDRAVGKLGEADVSRALNLLEAEGLVTQESRHSSPTGKGRPVYRPTVDRETVAAVLETDDHVAPMLETFREDWA
ncbi:MAG: hypothetical protein V5A43_10720 [Haloarculaceae archaeon]